MRSLLVLVFLLVSYTHSASARENKDLERGKFYYNHFAYYEAIPYFEKVADSLKDPVVYAQLGDCYRAIANLPKAAEWYSKSVATPGYTATTSLKYGQVLMQLMRYEEAEQQLKSYSENNPTDRRAVNLIAGCKTAPVLLKGTPAGRARMLDVSTESSEFAPTVWKNRLVFTSDTVTDVKKKMDRWTGNAYYNIYRRSCDSNGHVGTDFDKVAKTKELNIKFHTGPCTFSGDGSQMYFTRSRYNDNFLSKSAETNKDSVVVLEIMIASDYDDKEGKFKKIEPFQHNNKNYSLAQPAISPNGKLLVFSSTMPGGAGGSDLYLSVSIGGDGWRTPINMGPTINTEGEEVFPYWVNDSMLSFSSDGQVGLGGLDIYTATWNSELSTHTSVENAGVQINSSYDDVSLAMRTDLDKIYFSSNRPATKAGDNLYFYKKKELWLKLRVTDSLTGRPIGDASVNLAAATNKQDATTNEAGIWFTRLAQADYTLEANKEGYNARKMTFGASYNDVADTVFKELQLGKPTKEVNAIPPIEPLPPVSFTKMVGIPELNQIYEIGHFYFAFDKSDLNDTAMYVLDSLAGYLAMHPTMRIQVRAHTDCRGGDAYNLKLSKERAMAVVNYLSKKGIARKRLEYEGFGNRRPKVPCPMCEKCTDEQHYLNRVLEFKVLQL